MAYIVSALRTAGGKRGGRLSGWHPVDLGATILNALVDKTKMDPALIDDVIMGCVDQAGEQSSNIARNCVLASNLPESVPGTSIDRQCGSSQQALHFAAQAVMSGTMDIVIAAGVESMTRVPMGLPSILPRKNNFGYYMSPNIQKRYPGVDFSQFMGAEMMAKKYNLTRDDLDVYSLESHRRAIAATEAGFFADEVVPIEARIFNAETNMTNNTGEMHTVDEGIRFDATPASIGKVKALQEGGVITAANASQICDGASGVMVVNERGLKLLGVEPLARIHHMSVMGHCPVIMLEAPLPATDRALSRAGMKLSDIDLFEINEAFASVSMAWLRHTGADYSKLNVNGGAVSLGHPLVSRLLVSLRVPQLPYNDNKYDSTHDNIYYATGTVLFSHVGTPSSQAHIGFIVL
jgi:acetyl-CoA C-acetyltransferase